MGGGGGKEGDKEMSRSSARGDNEGKKREGDKERIQ